MGQEQVVARPHLQRKERELEVAASKAKGPNDTFARDKSKMRDYYSAWDSVDVDAMEAELEEEDRREEEARKKHFDDLREEQERAHNSFSPIDGGCVPESVPSAHRKHLADSE